MTEKYDLIIVGGGPAGLTAAIYALRRQLKVALIAKSLGGQAALASEVQNWPGIGSISGFELMQTFIDQAKKLGLKPISGEVKEITKNQDGFFVDTFTQSFIAGSVILSFGLTPRDLGVPGENELKGRGVTYCATCDGPLFRNKTVAVVGGGNSALEAAEYLARLAQKVYLINNSDKFGGENLLLDKIKKIKNIELRCSHQVKELQGKNKLEKIILSDAGGKETEELAADGIFVEIGHMAKTDWLSGFVKLNKHGEIIADQEGRTSVEGVFAAGDCADSPFKQIVIAAGAGAKAALSAYKYLASRNGKTARPDWGKC